MKGKTINIILYTLTALIVFAGVHITQEFRFYTMESNDLFIYDVRHVMQTLMQPGGFALLIASFLTQFMRMPFVGTLVATAVYMIAGVLIINMLHKRRGGSAISGFSFVPVAFLYLCLENDYYRFQGHIAFLLALLVLWIFISMRTDRCRIRLISAVAAVPLLYWLAGSAAAVFAVTYAVSEIVDRGVKGLYSLICPLLYVLTAFVFYRLSFIGTFEAAVSPSMYYSHPSTYFFPAYAWTSVPVLWIAAFLLSRFDLRRVSWVYVAAGIAVSLFIAGNLYSKVHSRSSYRLIQEQYLADKGEWDRIIETADRKQPTYLVSYLNLALAHKDMLLERLPYFNPQPVDRIMMPTPNLKHGFTLQSDVYLSWGYVAAARQAAFDANLVTPGMHNPHQLKKLIITDIVLESYGTAEKYIGILERTLFYRSWARNMRRYLDDRAAVMNDPYLGDLCRAVPEKSEYIRYEGLKGDMRDILEAYPSHRILSQFHAVYSLLEKEGGR